MKTVFVIEKLAHIGFSDRHIVAICGTEDLAKIWIKHQGGNQLVMLDDGSIIPEYEINERSCITELSQIFN